MGSQCDGVEVLSLSAPSCIHDAVSESFVQFRCVGAVCAVNLYASCDGDESEDVVAVDGPAAVGECVVDAFLCLVDDEHVV